MKRILLPVVSVAALFLFGFSKTYSTITPAERAQAVRLMEEGRAQLLKDVAGLSDAQLAFKPAPDRWSVAQCVEHIALAENGISQFIRQDLQGPPNPALRDSIKVTDDQLIQGVLDRSHKMQAPEQLQPVGKFPSTEAALKAFEEARAKNIDFIKTTKDDLRGHVLPQTPAGPLDCYQMYLLMAQHTKRHTMQLEEVMHDPNFPKN